jgi:hypothetical protein
LSRRSRWIPVAEVVADVRDDVLGEDAALWSHHAGQPHRIIALPCADIRDRHAGLYLGKLHHFLRLAGAIARILGRESAPTIGATSRCAVGNCGSDGCALQAERIRIPAAAATLLHILDLDVSPVTRCDKRRP